MSKRIIVQYMPELSKEAIDIITHQLSYSMISNDETSCQYEIDQCLKVVKKFGSDDCESDLWKINELILDGVHYLEL